MFEFGFFVKQMNKNKSFLELRNSTHLQPYEGQSKNKNKNNNNNNNNKCKLESI